MKPIFLKFQCFGPYMEQQEIHFDELQSKGIFLISGETGSGKTTILDAICYALYGKSSGGLRGDIEVMRCKSAKETDKTFVEYIFESNGNTYKFHRELAFGRKNMNEHDGCEILRDGVFEPIFANPKKTAVNQKAEEIIGLTYDQFCQVVILPQGKFEKLLVSNSEEKEKILTNLFHADRWNSIVLTLKAQTDAENKRLDTEYKDMESRLHVFDCTSLEALKEKTEARKKAVETLREEASQAEKQKAEAEKAYAHAIKNNEIFSALKDCEANLNALAAQRTVQEAKREKLKRAAAADAIREVFTSYKAAKLAFTEAKQKAETAKQTSNTMQNAFRETEQKAKAHEAAKVTYEENKQKHTRLCDARTVYEEIVEKKAAAEKAYRAEAESKRAAESAQAAYKSAAERWDTARKANDKAVAQYQEISHLYNANIAGILAKDLQEGVPCPVCGSTSHPYLAKVEQNFTVSAEDVDAANEAIKQTSTALQQAKAERDRTEKVNQEAQDVWNSCKEKFAATKAEYTAALQKTIEGIPNAEALEKAIRTVSAEVQVFEQTEEKIAGELKSATEKLAAANQSLTDAEKALAQTKENGIAEAEKWKQALVEKGFADEIDFTAAVLEKEALHALQEEIAAFEAAFQAAQEALEKEKEKTKGLTAPDMVKAEAAKAATQEVSEKKSRAFATESHELSREEKEYKHLSGRFEAYIADKQAADSNTDFVRRLNPSSGMSLQRYVLSIMLSSITVAANQLLRNVHGGKYQLTRSNESAGSARKAGLELNVLDTTTGEERSVTTLSGGEKFLVALCLAIGLSTVVQAQSGGTKLEAMFIDEGFGSLDDGSIDDALEVLQGIQRSHGLVGIISHVDKLSETIPTRLDVLKSANGNQIHCVF